MRRDPASSHILKTYRGLVFTELRGDVTGSRGALPPWKSRACCLLGLLHPRPQAPETCPLGPGSESLARGCLCALGLKQCSALCKQTAPTMMWPRDPSHVCLDHSAWASRRGCVGRENILTRPRPHSAASAGPLVGFGALWASMIPPEKWLRLGSFELIPGFSQFSVCLCVL